MPKGGRWKWYTEGEGGRDWQPMTTMLKHLQTEADSYHLGEWKKRCVLVGAAMREDIRLGAQAIGPAPWSKEDKDTLSSLAYKALEAGKGEDGATLGTAMHTATERVDFGEDVLTVAAAFPPVYRKSLQAYEHLVRVNGWEVVEVERTVRMSELGVAGTFDRIYRIPGYGLVIGDVKTEGAPLLNLMKIGAQLGGYANGDAMWSPGDGWAVLDGEPINLDVGVLVHVRDGEAVPYLLDLRKGYEAAKAAAAQRDRSKSAKTALGSTGCWAAPMPVKLPAPAELLTAAAVRADYANPARPEIPVGGQVEVGGITFTKIADPVDAAFGTPPAVTDTAAHEAAQFAEKWRAVVHMIWTADNRNELAGIYDGALAGGVPWAGPVAQAGEARLRIVECVQRAMHSPANSVRCACGWTREVRP